MLFPGIRCCGAGENLKWDTEIHRWNWAHRLRDRPDFSPPWLILWPMTTSEAVVTQISLALSPPAPQFSSPWEFKWAHKWSSGSSLLAPCCAACTATRGQHLPTTTAAGASPQAGCPPSPIAADAQVSKGCLQSHCLEPNQGFSSSDAGSSLSPPLLPWVPGSVFKSLCLIYRKSFSSMCWLILCPLWVNWPVGLSWRQTPHCLLHHSPQPLPLSVQAKLPSQKLFPQWKSTHAKDTSSLPTLTLHDIYCLNP